MSSQDFGVAELVEEDRVYLGSRYSDVRDAVFANPYQKVWGAPGEPPLPFVAPTLAHMKQALPNGENVLAAAAARTVDSRLDLRWGPDGKGFRRIVHPHGVCLAGLWRITEDNDYSGYFTKGSEALVIARYSNGVQVKRGNPRGQGIAGKLFPTNDPHHAEPLRTANFFVIEDIVGSFTKYLGEVQFVNAPNVTITNDLGSCPMAVSLKKAFEKADVSAIERQLHEVAELGKAPGAPTRTPRFMKLMLEPGHPVIEGEELDSRDEILAMMFDKGDPAPKRKLTFSIEVTDEGELKKQSFLGRVRTLDAKEMLFENWRRIGTLTFDNGVASYNGDHVLHFHHPYWREDRNDPATAFRKER